MSDALLDYGPDAILMAGLTGRTGGSPTTWPAAATRR